MACGVQVSRFNASRSNVQSSRFKVQGLNACGVQGTGFKSKKVKELHSFHTYYNSQTIVIIGYQYSSSL